jgi:hypothetical protein
MVAKKPIAFLTYAHSDDAHEGGKLRQLAGRLSGEVQLLSGEEFPIFVDRKDLKAGHPWRAGIDDSLDGVTFLIPILTPAYFRSEECRREFLRFLEKERDLKREDLILPLYYVNSPVLEDEAKRAGNDVAKVLRERQYQDWRHLRHKPLTDPDVARSIEEVARRMADALDAGVWTRQAIVDARAGIGPPHAPPPAPGTKSTSTATPELGPANMAADGPPATALIDRRAGEKGSPYKRAVICLRHRSNAEDLFEGAFTSGGDVLYITVMSQATLKTMRSRLDTCKTTGTKIRVLTWYRKISESVIEAYRKHLNEPYPERAVEQARRATADWRVLETEYPQNVFVREYASIPTMQGIIVHDKWAVLELIPYATHPNERPALVLTPESDSELFALFAKQFERLWDQCTEPVGADEGPPVAPARPTIT